MLKIDPGVTSRIQCAGLCSADSQRCNGYLYTGNGSICHLMDFKLKKSTQSIYKMDEPDVYVDIGM